MLPSLFISHGSPMLALQPGASGPALARLAADLPRPTAIVVMSAHWESRELLVSASPAPETWHDFGGFPRELFAVQYPAPGDPALAQQIVELLIADGLQARLDHQRPFDHGTWVPLSLMYPAADIPVVQVSLPSHMGPALQTRIGQALRGLREQGVLVIGSGMSFHNMAVMRNPSLAAYSVDFDHWLGAAAQAPAEERAALLAQWEQAPNARHAHPREEHLIPLMVAAGASGAAGTMDYSESMMGSAISAYRFA